MKYRFANSLIILFTLLALVFSPFGTRSAHASGIRYAKPIIIGNGDCSSWANACTLQTALTGAASGDEIWVMTGVHRTAYATTDRNSTFQLKEGVALYGGFVGTETLRSQRDPAANITVLSGVINIPATQYPPQPASIVNSYHVVTGANGATLDGFTIIGGNADGDVCPGSGCGGGLYNASSSPTITNVTFSGNSSTTYGGGMYNTASSPTLTNVTFSANSATGGGGMYNNASSPMLTNVTFSGNSSTTYGGGMYNTASSPTLTNVTFSANSATGGGGMYNKASSPMLTNVTFTANSANQGGGMFNYGGSTPTITNVTFNGNLAAVGGGLCNSYSSLTITNVTFSGNLAYDGGGMYTDNSNLTNLTNVTFNGNSATFRGGGMYVYGDKKTILTNVTFNANSAAAYGGGMYIIGTYLPDPTAKNLTAKNVTFSTNSAATSGGGIFNHGASATSLISNTIFWGNTAQYGAQFRNISGPTISNSVVQDGYTDGTDIITADPQLGTLGSYGGFTQTIPLLPGSSAINAGNAASCAAGSDQRGINYVGVCDIGAFESQGFILAITAGNNQSVPPNAAFPTPLTVSVTANNTLEPVDGGQVVFTPPASGAAATLSGGPSTIASGLASVSAAANDTPGIYTVTTSVSGATSINFSLANQLAPVITWANPSNIIYGTALSDTQLNATANVPGTFTYTPASGEVLTVGPHTLHVDFIPGDAVNYSNASKDVSITVLESTSPTVLSITRVNPNPTNLTSVDYTVTFSEAVTGVDNSDFSFTTSIVAGAAVSGISGSGSLYTVTVNTGSGDGTIRLNVVDDNSIVDAALNPLGGAALGDGDFTSGEVYTIIKSATFTDVPLSYWSNTFIERLYNAGITGGCSTTPLMYCPESPVTRAQMAVFLLRGIHGSSYSPPAVGVSTGFNDVPIDYWSASWIKQLAVEGITGGCGVGLYCPETIVTRAQMAVFLLRAKYTSAHIPPIAIGTFADVPMNYWSAGWIEQLAVEGITSGCGVGIYCPESNVTRAQMAVFLVKTFNLP